VRVRTRPPESAQPEAKQGRAARPPAARAGSPVRAANGEPDELPDRLTPDAERLASVHAALLGWYERAGRDLPWRRTRDPYVILVSEVMLQQTQVDRVIPKLHEFLAAYPTFAALAAAPLGEVIRRWAPLGYNRRAVHLHGIARAVVERFGGRLPDQVEILRTLRGLGSYTANAVACFAFGQCVPVVDTNIRRVLGRLFADLIGLDPPPGRAIEAFARAVLPPKRAYDWNQALMDLGATICTARAPACGSCPLALACVGRPLLADTGARLPRAAERRERYVVTPPFEQTTRYYRGRIVDRLRDLGPGESLSLDDIGRTLRPDFGPQHLAWVADLVEGLRRDGLAATTDGPDGLRVTLP
jgi:A/G-specific adenine glycosylase